MISVIFVEPEGSGNIGSMARVMANFDLANLVLVNPCKITNETRAMAMHAFEVVEGAKVFNNLDDAINNFDIVIGTTGRVTKDYHTIRNYIVPKQLREKLTDKSPNIALVFGRETTGLTNEELSKCDIVVHIPSSEKYPVLNVTHAAAILFYELFALEKGLPVATKPERDALVKQFKILIDASKGIKDKNECLKIFENITNKSFLASKEARALTGVFKEFQK